MRFLESVAWLIVCVSWQATPAWAHPGHGTAASSTSWSHYLVEPVHVAQIACLLAAAGFVIWRRARIAPRVALERVSK